MASQPPLPPGFVLDGSAPGGPITVGNPRPPAPPSGFRPSGDGLEPIPGGPADPTRTPPSAPAGYRFRPDGNLEIIPGGPADESATGSNRDLDAARAELRNVVDAARRARELSRNGWFTTGFGSPIAGSIPGTSARDLQGLLNTIGSNTAFDRLSRMRAESKTGGALGSVSEIELQLLRDSIAALDPGQSDESFQANMDRIIERYAGMYERLGGNPADLGGGPGVAANILPNAVNQATEQVVGAVNNPLPPGPRGELQFRDEQAEDTNPLEPDQQRIYDAFVQSNPNATPQQLRDFAQRAFGLTLDNAEAIVQNAPGGFAPGQTATVRPPDISDVRGAGRTSIIPEDISATIRGGGDILTMGNVDDILALRDTLFSGGTMEENRARQLAIDEFDNENNFSARTIGQIGASFLIPSRAPAAFATGGIRAGATRLAGEGAALGGAYGFGSTNGGLGDRLLGAGSGAFVGGTTAGATGLTLGRLMTPSTPRVLSPERAEVVQAAQSAADLGIDMMPADMGGSTVRRATAVAHQLPLSTGLVTRGARRTQNQAMAARDRTAQSVGNVSTMEDAGTQATRGAQNFVARTGAQATALYTRATAAAGDARVPLPRAIANVDQQIAELADTPGGGQAMLAPLQRIRQGLDGNWTPDSIRRMRTSITQEFVDGGLTQGDASRRARQITAAAEDDMIDGLRAAGRGHAARAYATATRYYRQRMQTIDQTIEPIIGDGTLGGEEVMRRLTSASRGNTARILRFVQSLPAEEANNVRATMIDALGRSAPGRQNARSDAFSLETFLTHFNQMQPRVRTQLFPPEARQALQRLANVAGQSRQAQRFQNVSQTGAIVGGVATVGHAFAEPITFVAAALGQVAAGALLASPRIARWIARVPRAPGAMPAYTRQLAQIARAEPQLAANIAGLQARLTEAFAQSPTRAAAEEPENRR